MRPAPALFALVAALLIARGAGAASLPAPPAPTAPVPPGAVVVTAAPTLPAGVEEFELLLVPESGPAIRVSAETRAGTRAIRWRMPAVASRRARLVWRVGGEQGEWESEPSAAFELAPLPEGERDRVLQGRSEAGVAIESAPGASVARFGVSTPPPVFSCGGEPAGAVESTAPPLALPRAVSLRRDSRTFDAPASPGTPGARSRAPFLASLRI